MAANPATTQAVVTSVLAGWTRAFDDPDEAVDVCVAVRPDLSRAHHERQLAAIRALALTGATLVEGLGFPDPRHGADALAALNEVEGHAPAIDAAALVDRSFWDTAPAAVRRNRW